MTTHCKYCLKLQRVSAVMETVNLREGMKARAFLECGHVANFVTTAEQLEAFRHSKRLISEGRIED